MILFVFTHCGLCMSSVGGMRRLRLVVRVDTITAIYNCSRARKAEPHRAGCVVERDGVA